MTKRRWLSFLILLIAYMTFGWFLKSEQASQLSWILSVTFAFTQASILTLLWRPAREFALLGFQSDAGYFVMVLCLASLAVAALAWVQVFVYFLVMVAAALLVRVDLLAMEFGNVLSFLALSIIPILGLALSWMLNLS